MTSCKDTITDKIFYPINLPLQALRSAAGYYIGQLEPCGVPFSRISDCYYKTREDAEDALRTGFPIGRTENASFEVEAIKRHYKKLFEENKGGNHVT